MAATISGRGQEKTPKGGCGEKKAWQGWWSGQCWLPRKYSLLARKKVPLRARASGLSKAVARHQTSPIAPEQLFFLIHEDCPATFGRCDFGFPTLQIKGEYSP